MTANQRVASALMSLVTDHLLSEEPTGALLYQVQEFCEDYEEIKNIFTDINTQTKEEQQQVLLEYARMYNFSRDDIIKRIKEENL